MILPGGRFQVFVATRPVDFRKGMDGLAAVVQETLRLDPFWKFARPRDSIFIGARR